MALVAVVAIVAPQSGPPPRPPSAPNAGPATLAPDRYTAGVQWTGQAGITETVAEIMARAASEPQVTGPPRERRRLFAHTQRGKPGAAAFSQWPARPAAAAKATSDVAFDVTTNFLGTRLSESG